MTPVRNTTARRDALTAPVEDYLKAIYTIGRGSGAAATNEIAERLALAPASVSGMVRRLADQGLLAYERYHGVKLTESGRRAALRTLRRHRVIEAYLARALGYPWDRVHEEAERLEHAASDELIDRMAVTIGEPEVDPHGALSRRVTAASMKPSTPRSRIFQSAYQASSCVSPTKIPRCCGIWPSWRFFRERG
jgi:DtxR family Mn-dependent transcriptional regulator